MLGHPPRACEMIVVDLSGTFTISVRIESEQNVNNFRPLRSLFGGIEKPNVEHEVLSIVIGQARALRRPIVKCDAGLCTSLVRLTGLAPTP